MGDVGRLSTAEYRGVWGRALLTRRAGGLEKLYSGPIWAALKWSRAAPSRADGLVRRQNHVSGPIGRTRARALTRPPLTVAGCVCVKDGGLGLHGKVRAGSPQRVRAASILGVRVAWRRDEI